MQTSTPNGKIKSNMVQVFDSMQITEKRQRNWSTQRRNIPVVGRSVRISRAVEDLKMKKLQFKSEIGTRGEKKFLVVKRIGKIFSPIGFRRQFKTVDSLKKFAKEEGRAIVRVICGAVKKNYPVEA